MPDSTVEIENVGPVHSLSFPVPESGGLMILLGPNGSGKTNVLEALSALASKSGTIPVTDGADRAQVSAYGATLRMGRRLSRLGELEVVHIEGKFSLADLVDPKISDVLAADAKRIKALLTLSGSENAKPDISLFYPLLGGQEAFDVYVPSDVAKTPDLVAMASRVKSSLEKAAREHHDRSVQEATQAEASRLAFADVDLKQPDDSTVLDLAHQDAIRQEAKLKAEAKANTDAKKRKEEAEAALATTKEAYQGISLEEAVAAQTAAEAKLVDAEEEVKRLEQLLAKAKSLKLAAEHGVELSKKSVQSAETFQRGVDALQAVIDGEIPPAVSLVALEDAAEKVKATSEAKDTGALVRQAKKALAEAKALKKSAKEAEDKSIQLRDAALSTDTVLSNAVQSLDCPLYVSGGRLMTNTADRGAELFQDLSKGEKCSLAVRIAIKAVGPGGLVVVPQEFFEGLNPQNRIALAAEFENTGVVGITAMAADGEGIVAEQFEAFPLG